MAQNVKKSLSLYERVLAILKLGDEGKVKSFFEGEVKAAKNEIRKLEANLMQKELAYKLTESNFDEQIEDAEQALEDAYLNVNAESVQTNEARRAYAVKYWANIQAKEKALERVKAEKEASEAEFLEYKKDNTAQRRAYTKRASRLAL